MKEKLELRSEDMVAKNFWHMYQKEGKGISCRFKFAYKNDT